jgi:lysozyme
MTPSPWLYDFLKQHEGFRPTAYHGKADRKGLYTIGWGHTGGVQPGDTCTLERGQALLEADVASTAAELTKLLATPLRQNQFDALVSLAYNVGVHSLAGHELIALVNQGRYVEAASHFCAYDMAVGVVVPGLLTRREAERDHFLLAA